jgi:hypothetical protein
MQQRNSDSMFIGRVDEDDRICVPLIPKKRDRLIGGEIYNGQSEPGYDKLEWLNRELAQAGERKLIKRSGNAKNRRYYMVEFARCLPFALKRYLQVSSGLL